MKNETDSKSKAENTPNWLRNIQLNSWEAELLISALVLYALFQIPDFIQKSSLQNFERGSYAITFSTIIIRSIDLVKLGYVLHIMVRGIWVSSIGFSYVFPKGARNEVLKFKGKFKSEIEKSTGFVKNVLKLEELSSLIYGVSFIMFGCLIGVGILLLIYVYIGELMSLTSLSANPIIAIPTGILFFLFMLSTIIIFVDFITSGLFRRKSWSVKWFYPIAWVFRILTLSFLYRKSILVLQSNVKDWKRYFIPISILTFILSFILIIKEQRELVLHGYFKKTQEYNFQPVNYESKRGEKDVLISTIQSDIVKDNIVQIYLNDLKLFRNIYTREVDTVKNWNKLNSLETTEYLNEWINIKIDSTELDKIQWRITQHPLNFKYGFISYLDLSAHENGSHVLQVELDTVGMKPLAKEWIGSSEYNYHYLAFMPFYLNK